MTEQADGYVRFEQLAVTPLGARAPSVYERIASEVGKLVTEKNTSYGDSFAKSGDILRILYPAGLKPHQFVDALAVVRILDKLFRIANDKRAFSESPARDIAGYALLMVANDEGKPTRGDYP